MRAAGEFVGQMRDALHSSGCADVLLWKLTRESGPPNSSPLHHCACECLHRLGAAATGAPTPDRCVLCGGRGTALASENLFSPRLVHSLITKTARKTVAGYGGYVASLVAATYSFLSYRSSHRAGQRRAACFHSVPPGQVRTV